MRIDDIEDREDIEKEKMDEGDREELERVEEELKKEGEVLTKELEEKLWKVTIGAGHDEGEKMKKETETIEVTGEKLRYVIENSEIVKQLKEERKDMRERSFRE